MRDSGSFTKTARPRGTIKFHPYEELDELSMREIAKFQVTPFGRIKECCAHIPYNSGKKDFYEKTGRESFEGGLPSSKTRSPRAASKTARRTRSGSDHELTWS